MNRKHFKKNTIGKNIIAVKGDKQQLENDTFMPLLALLEGSAVIYSIGFRINCNFIWTDITDLHQL